LVPRTPETGATYPARQRLSFAARKQAALPARAPLIQTRIDS